MFDRIIIEPGERSWSVAFNVLGNGKYILLFIVDNADVCHVQEVL